jgi:hypothetical protein
MHRTGRDLIASQQAPTGGRVKFYLNYHGPSVSELDEQGRRLFYRMNDLEARFWLNDRTMPEFDAKNFDGVSTLVHAERYLADRFAYELAPWPKGKIKIEPPDAYALPPK